MNSGAGRKVMRILITLLGAAFILQAAVSMALGIAGERTTAVITHIRRELGERGESIPNRYTYIVSYAFTTADGQSVSSYVRRIGSAVYVKADGKQQASVRYFRPLPAVNTLEQDSRISWGKAVLLGAGAFLIVAVNRPRGSVKLARGRASIKGVRVSRTVAQPGKPAGGSVGYSNKINDPAFACYMNDARRWSFLFAFVLAVIAVAGFYIYGETSQEMANPEALYIGLGIGGMFIAIAMLQEAVRQKTKSWDGVVVDKRIEQKQRRSGSGTDGHMREAYILYTVVIRSDAGEPYSLSAEDDITRYQYYQIGDRVRYHTGLNSLEKYDKSGDGIIFCNACGSLNDIHDDHCFRCSCPLLK